MKIHTSILGLFFLLAIVTSLSAQNGSGDVKLGYVFIDEKGNQSVNQPTFNYYPGFALGIEKFRYNWSNGLRVNADLKNITLNNRNLHFNLSRPGLFGIQVTNNQYRRFYNFDGSDFTRRSQSGGSIWLYPHRYIKLYGGGDVTNFHGSIDNLFNPAGHFDPGVFDYNLKSWNAGARFNYRGRMLEAEYRAAEYTDNKNSARDRFRSNVRLFGLLVLPKLERVTLSGGFRHFLTEYKDTKFKISANTVWGAATIKVTEHITADYNFIFDRAGSDSDLVATDNISHTGYLSYLWTGLGGLTGGYQYDTKDDFSNEVKSNSFYLSGWFNPGSSLEIRSEFGRRMEKVDEGARLLGNEDRNRFKVHVKFRNATRGSIAIRFENKHRNNDELGSTSDFNAFGIDGTLKLNALRSNLSGGYSYSFGKYRNVTRTFNFGDHLAYGDISLAEYRNMTAGFGVTYYRSKRDLDIESFILTFRAGYRFFKSHRLEAVYNVHNFDDFLVSDRYYTANIVEVNLIKELSF